MNNKEYLQNNQKEYLNLNRDKINEYKKQYYNLNKDNILSYKKQYYANKLIQQEQNAYLKILI